MLLIRIARWILLIHIMRRFEEKQDLIHGLANINVSLLPVRVGPQVGQQRVQNHNGHEADVVVLGRPVALVRVVDEKLLRPRVDGVLGRLRHLGLVRVRPVGRHSRQQVAVELVPRALHRPAAQPLVELAGVLERQQLEDEALPLLGKRRHLGNAGGSSGARRVARRRRGGRRAGYRDAHGVWSAGRSGRRGSGFEGIGRMELSILKGWPATETEAHVVVMVGGGQGGCKMAI